MSNNENKPQIEEIDEAAALFAQITSEDSDKDSGKPVNEDSKLDQDDDTDTDEGQDDSGEGQSDQEDDPWQSAPEALRQQYQTLKQALQKSQNDYQAVYNRLAPTQRDLEKFKKLVAESEQAKGGKPKEDAPTQEDLNGMTDEDIEAEYPELAAFLKARDKQLSQMIEEKLSPLQKIQQEREQEQQKKIIDSELSRVEAAHPDFRNVVADQAFQNWLAGQPNAIKRIAESMDADDNIALLNLYKGTRQPAKPANKTKDLSNHVAIPRKGGGKPSSDLDSSDPVELFNRITT
ncbi:MAG: hypothetical protein GW836_00640 [Paraglaciecola sp.]|nr:hypothetical protein [Paraglaciecola sp.]